MSIGVMNTVIFLGGVFILIYGLFFSPTEEEESILSSSIDSKGIDELLLNLDSRLNDADKMMSELDKFSAHVQSEMDNKYKDMMFLFQMVDEKQQCINSEKEILKAKEEELNRIQYEQEMLEAKRREEERIAMERNRMMKTYSSNLGTNVKKFYVESPSQTSTAALNQVANIPVNGNVDTRISASNVNRNNFDEVIYMYESGKSVDEIAKSLGKGKGEIRLMLDLLGKEG